MTISCPECHAEIIILPESNEPLSWDELQDMVGKPVWIEAESLSVGVCPYWKDWYIIQDFEECPLDDYMLTTPFIQWWKSEIGTVWNAYRKERE